MKEKLVRWKFYFDKDKEEQWLNEMAAKGWSMKSFFAGRYTFEQTQPGEYLYQVELLPRNVKEKAEYLHFLEHEMGVELVQEWGFWIFLRKKRAKGLLNSTPMLHPRQSITGRYHTCFLR